MPKLYCDLILNPAWTVPVAPAPGALENLSIAISEGRIVALDVREHLHQQFDAAQAIELPDHVVLPGLVNAHGHAAMSLFRGYGDDAPVQTWLSEQIWPLEARLVNPDFVRDGARLALAEMIRSGTTCFADMYFFPEVTAAEAANAGVRAQVAFPVIEFANAWSVNADAGFHKGLALHDEYRNHDRVQIAFGPHAAYSVTSADLEKILMYSEELDANVHIHLHENASEVAAARELVGRSWVEHLYHQGFLGPRVQAVHMTQLTDAEIDMLAQTGTHVVHCPHSNLKLASGTCPTTRLLAHGVNVALGTDGAASNDSLDLLQEARLASLLAKSQSGSAAALPAHQVLELATLGGARALGLDAQIGSIEPGKYADLIAVDLAQARFQPVYDPVAQLVHTSAGTSVTHVWVAGQPLLNSGRLTRLDETDILARARHWRERVIV